jgi:hypothetical protein
LMAAGLTMADVAGRSTSRGPSPTCGREAVGDTRPVSSPESTGPLLTDARSGLKHRARCRGGRRRALAMGRPGCAQGHRRPGRGPRLRSDGPSPHDGRPCRRDDRPGRWRPGRRQALTGRCLCPPTDGGATAAGPPAEPDEPARVASHRGEWLPVHCLGLDDHVDGVGARPRPGDCGSDRRSTMDHSRRQSPQPRDRPGRLPDRSRWAGSMPPGRTR